MTASVHSRDHISVCVCTYHRNELLERLLRTLARQHTRGMFAVSIVIVDNDPAGPARELALRLQAALGLEITYSIEPEHTIPAARNHAVRLARGNYIAIIDDDEFASPEWLLHMYQAIQTFGVDGALGPVYSFFDDTPPAWLMTSRFCESHFWSTGSLLRWHQTRTGNVMLRSQVFHEHGLCFDGRFRTGGSDQEFFRQASARGLRFVAVKEAPVYEVVPPERWTLKYWIKRALVNGFNAEKYAAAGMARAQRVALTLKSIVAAVIYASAVPISATLGQARLACCLEKFFYHLSRACASFGVELHKKRDF